MEDCGGGGKSGASGGLGDCDGGNSGASNRRSLVGRSFASDSFWVEEAFEVCCDITE